MTESVRLFGQLLGCLMGAATLCAVALPLTDPESVGMESWFLARIATVVDEAINKKEFPGCVVCIGRRGRLVHHKAYGTHDFEETAKPIAIDTLFDVASLTKPVATATCIMSLIEQGMLKLDDTVASYIPEFGVKGKEKITIRDLLLHQSGLIADNPLSDYEQGPNEALSRLCALPFRSSLCSLFTYLDINYVLLGEVIKRVTNRPVNAYARDTIFRPLGMSSTTFLPQVRQRLGAATTGKRGDRRLRGEVHDTRAHLLGGIAGHAGLFSTAHDLALYAQMLLDEGRCGRVHILRPSSVELMTCGKEALNGKRALGWDKQSEHSTNRAEKLSERAFGHGGFTGVAMWIDPELELFYIVLSNRNLTNPKENVYRIIARIGDYAVEAISQHQKAFQSHLQAGVGKSKRFLQHDRFLQHGDRCMRVPLVAPDSKLLPV